MKDQKVSSLSYLCLILISMSADVESNPGPTDFPCGNCAIEVLDDDAALECDKCGLWFHIQCQAIGQDMYDDLVATDQSFSWICSNCDHPNFSNSSFASSIASYVSPNNFSILTDEDSEPDEPLPQEPTPRFAHHGPSINKIYNLKVLNINCQSLVNKKAEFQALLDLHKPDIVVGTESWLTPEHHDSEFFPSVLGYTPFREDRVTDTKGGGVFILVKDSLYATEQKQFKTNCEIIWIKLSIVAAKPLYIAAYYRPRESDVQGLEELRKSLELVSKKNGNIWILGDFNFPKLSWDSDHMPTMKPGCRLLSLYKDFLSCLDDFDLVQMVSKPTRGDNILDLFLTSNHTLVNSTEILPGISDHDIISATVSVKPKLNKQKPRSVPIFRKADWDGFKLFIREKSFEILGRFQESTPEEIWNAFKSALNSGIEKFVPIKKLSTKSSLPWITQEIRRLIRKRDKLYQKQKSGTTKDRYHFKQVKHLVQGKIRQAYNNYLADILGVGSDGEGKNSGFSPKKLFSLIKNSRQDSRGISTLKDNTDGTLHSENTVKANLLNRQFQSVFTRLSPLRLGQLCTKAVLNLFQENLPENLPSQCPSMPEINIDLNGVLKLLANLKPDKAAGPDSIKPLVLKELRLEIAPVICLLFQKSLETGQLPADWIKAQVCPLYKKGDKTDPANYRPISLTCIVCKVMEHIIASNISKHMTQQNALYELQHGFREKRSCETQLIQLVEDLARQLTLGKQTDLVLLDFSKAFDKVNHLKLLYKLSNFGITGNTLKWIESFLIGRTQTVVLDGESSNEVPVTSGVPQGSVLGPLLFLLYINDLPDNIQSQVRLFADDTAVYLTVSSPSDTQTLQSDLERLQLWERTWDMEFNPSKCQVIHISRSKKPIKSKYFMHGQELESVDSAKYLGVTISKDLSWNSHISNIAASANRTLGFVKRNVKTKNQDIKTLAYNTLVRPQVEYASAVWSPYTKENINKIEMLQRRAARWVTNDFSPYSSVTDMMGELGWRSLELRRYDARLTMFYKIVYGLVAIPVPSQFERQTTNTRHHSMAYRQIHTSVSYYYYSFFPMTVVLWNRLPADLVLISDLDTFKSRISLINHRLP
ncbi:MAG: hypothetical protein JAY66_11960 [Candidatus Thiodiazotropha taylori]|nr:hypothetical protein [Candidatus Thiodiazotropha taylori]